MLNRREVLRIGGLSVLSSVVGEAGLSAETPSQQKSCIFMLLQGGPSHIDLWDPKPKAGTEVRGPFKSIDTSLPGLQLGELMKGTAKVAKHLAVIRSMTHRFNNHIAGTYIMLTGSEVQPNADREAHPDDAPGPGAVLNYLRRTPAKVPVSISLPNWLSIPGPSNRMPGQYAGMLGAAHDPFLIQGEPHKKEFKPLSLSLPSEVGSGRFRSRKELLSEIDRASRHLETRATRSRDRLYGIAYDLLTDPKVRNAIDLSQEPQASRDRYGMTKIGQSLLLARRLIGSGVKLVGYNTFNQGWDHHSNIERTLKSRVPPMEQAYSALIEDLDQRGMLDDTMVINTGEFGRTPVMNGNKGRDHWPDVYTTVLAGGGIRGGQVYGASDSKGGIPASRPVSPADVLATMWTCMGIDPHTELRDRLNRPIVLSRGQLIDGLL